MPDIDDLFKIDTEIKSPKVGDLLLASPDFSEYDYFKHAVIFITEITEKGVVGFLLNKKTDFDLEQLVKEVADYKILEGGPVNHDTLYFLHNKPDLIPHSLFIKDNLYWDGDFNTVIHLLKNKEITSNNIRFFLGYSGWEPLQLTEELKHKNWILEKQVKPSIVLNSSPEKLWEQLLEAKGGKYKLWANLSKNPNKNKTSEDTNQYQ